MSRIPQEHSLSVSPPPTLPSQAIPQHRICLTHVAGVFVRPSICPMSSLWTGGGLSPKQLASGSLGSPPAIPLLHQLHRSFTSCFTLSGLPFAFQFPPGRRTAALARFALFFERRCGRQNNQRLGCIKQDAVQPAKATANARKPKAWPKVLQPSKSFNIPQALPVTVTSPGRPPFSGHRSQSQRPTMNFLSASIATRLPRSEEEDPTKAHRSPRAPSATRRRLEPLRATRIRGSAPRGRAPATRRGWSAQTRSALKCSCWGRFVMFFFFLSDLF